MKPHYMSRDLIEYVTIEIEGYDIQHLIAFYHQHGFKDKYETDVFSIWIHDLNDKAHGNRSISETLLTGVDNNQ